MILRCLGFIKLGPMKKIASDVYVYIDDGRPTAGSTKASWRATQRVYQIIFFCLQDSCKKRTAPSQEPGEWVVISVNSTGDRVTVFVSVKKSGKSKDIILRITLELSEGERLDFKQLEKDRGYLV